MRMTLSAHIVLVLFVFLLGCNGGCKKPKEEPEVSKKEPMPKPEPPNVKPPVKSPQKTTPTENKDSPTAKSESGQECSKQGAGEGGSPGRKSNSDEPSGSNSGGGNSSGGGPSNGGGTSGGHGMPGGGKRGQRIPSLAESGGDARPSLSESLAKGEKELRAAQTALDKGDKKAALKHALSAWDATHDFGDNAECRAVKQQAEKLLEQFGSLPKEDDVDLSRVLIR